MANGLFGMGQRLINFQASSVSSAHRKGTKRSPSLSAKMTPKLFLMDLMSENETVKAVPHLDTDKLGKKKKAREDSGKVDMR